MLTIANVDMAKAWDGEEGERWTEWADHYERAGDRLWRRFLEAVPIGEADRVLDIGCGTGGATRDVARVATSGSVLGVDLSARMLALARERSAAEGLTNVTYEQADAQVHGFPEAEFDLAISSFGAMFFNDPVAAFTNIGHAVRPGGRLAMLAWQRFDRNEWLGSLREALAVGRSMPTPPAGAPGPFGLADPAGVRDILGSAGYDEVELSPVVDRLVLGTDLEDAYRFARSFGMVKGMTADLDEDGKAKALAAVRNLLASRASDDGVSLAAAAWLITARRAG